MKKVIFLFVIIVSTYCVANSNVRCKKDDFEKIVKDADFELSEVKLPDCAELKKLRKKSPDNLCLSFELTKEKRYRDNLFIKGSSFSACSQDGLTRMKNASGEILITKDGPICKGSASLYYNEICECRLAKPYRDGDIIIPADSTVYNLNDTFVFFPFGKILINGESKLVEKPFIIENGKLQFDFIKKTIRDLQGACSSSGD